jgi:putative heme-binding domain-containing protein
LKESSEPQVKLAAVQTLGRIGNSGDLRTLLAVAKENQDKDPTLLQAARISLRDLLRNNEALEVLISSWRFGADKPTATRMAVPLDDSLAREVASILPALDSELASEGLLSYVDAHSDASGEIVQAAIDGAAKHLNSRMTEALLRVVRKINGDDPIANAKMLDKICAAIVAKNLPYPPAIQAFAVEITANLVTKIEQALSASDTLSDWRDARGADWGSEERKCQDGQAMMATSSLSRGEAYVGTLVSSSFAAPAELEFWLCGHNGLPTEPDKQRNFVRLVHAQSGQVLQTAFPPRNDTAQRVHWDLAEHAGAPVRLELVDTDNAGAYAWLAVGRFSLGGLNRSQVGEQLGALNPLLRRRISTEVTEHVQGLAQSEKLSPRVRAELIGSIAEALQIPVVQAIAEHAIEMDQAAVVSSSLIAVDAIARSEMTNQVLQQISLASTARQQSAFAGRLLRSGVGCGHLVELLDAGKLSLASLRGRELLLPESCSEQDRARLTELAKQASALPDQNSQLVQDRLTRLQLDTASVEQGKLVFEKSCAICHQLGGKGTLIGPQLDGAGRRGAERLCEDVLDPHRNVDKAFRSSTLLLADDKVVTGLVREQADGSLQVIGQDGKAMVIPSSNVDQRRDSEKSLMPDNFAELLNDSDLAALLKYLTAAP